MQSVAPPEHGGSTTDRADVITRIYAEIDRINQSVILPTPG
jgi:hypothetical protein